MCSPLLPLLQSEISPSCKAQGTRHGSCMWVLYGLVQGHSAGKQASSKQASGSQEARPHPWIDVRMTGPVLWWTGFWARQNPHETTALTDGKNQFRTSHYHPAAPGHAGHPWHARGGRVIKFVFGLPGSLIVSSGTPARPLLGRHGRHGRFARAAAPSSSSLASPRAPSNCVPFEHFSPW